MLHLLVLLITIVLLLLTFKFRTAVLIAIPPCSILNAIKELQGDAVVGDEKAKRKLVGIQ